MTTQQQPRAAGSFRLPTSFEMQRWYRNQRTDLWLRDILFVAVCILIAAIAAILYFR